MTPIFEFIDKCHCRQICNIRGTLVGNKVVDHSNVVETAPVSNYIFILDLKHGYSGLDNDNCKTRREIFKFWDLVRLILDIWLYSRCKWSVGLYFHTNSVPFCVDTWLYIQMYTPAQSKMGTTQYFLYVTAVLFVIKQLVLDSFIAQITHRYLVMEHCDL